MLKKKHIKMKKLFLENKLMRNKLLLEEGLFNERTNKFTNNITWKDEYVDEEFYNIDGLNIEYISEGSFEDDYKKAYEVAKELGGEVYTVVDAGASDVIYQKGETDINALEVIVAYFDQAMVA